MFSASSTQCLSLAEYAADLRESGSQVFGYTDTHFWVRYESYALMRVPCFATGEPAPRVVDRLLWPARGLVAAYLLEPDQAHPPNAWLYVCTNRDYSVEKLAPAMRRNVRRGSRELRIEPVPVERLLDKGFQAFSDTRRRVGLSDGTREVFTKRFAAGGRCRGRVFLGAWHDQELAAFLEIQAVEDWAEIWGCFSSNAALGLRPNDTLIARALTDYLVTKRYKLVSYGLSSIQEVSNAAGLHEFKTKVGFEAKPVHRAFVAHPLLRPLMNRGIQRCVGAMLALSPGNRVLKKCEGVLSTMMGRSSFESGKPSQSRRELANSEVANNELAPMAITSNPADVSDLATQTPEGER